MPNVLSPRDLVPRPNNMDETVPHTMSDASETVHCTFMGITYIVEKIFR